MASTSRSSSGRKAAARRPVDAASSASAVAETNGNPIDIVLDEWSQNAAKEQIAWEISACTALLRSAQTLREAELDANRRAQQVHEHAAAQLKKAQGIGDLATVRMDLARADAQGVIQYWSKLGELTSKGALDVWNESASGFAKLQAAGWSALLQFSRVQAALPATAEVLEAEVEHVTSPLTASPLVWPAQEATRQAMSVAASTWNNWLSWPARWAEGSEHTIP